jgi:exopolysaccharide production protein ExoZ
MRRLYGLQYLRGVAALGVVAYHACDRAHVGFAVGKAGVDLFFVLSGFLMWTITGADSRPGRFLSDRLLRIVPLYWIVTSVMAAGALAHLFPAVRLTAWHIAASYLLLPAVSPSNGQVWPLLAPGWTLEYEIAFYLLFAATLTLPRRLQLPGLTAVLLGLAALHPLVPARLVMIRYYTDAHILEFWAGLVLAAGWRGGLFAHRWALPLLGTALALWIAALAATAPDWGDTALYGPPAVLLVALVLAAEARPGGVTDRPLLRHLGDASYSIYLWHTLAISVTAKLAEKLALPPLTAVPLHIVGGVVVGLAGYALIERPLMARLHRPRYRRGAPVPGGV